MIIYILIQLFTSELKSFLGCPGVAISKMRVHLLYPCSGIPL